MSAPDSDHVGPSWSVRDLMEADDDAVRAIHAEVTSSARRTVALAVVLGLMLEGAWERLGKGKFGAWLVTVKISASAANRYRNISRKWKTRIGPVPSTPKCRTTRQRLGVPVMGLSPDTTVPVPTTWKGKTFTQIAHPQDPDAKKSRPQGRGKAIEQVQDTLGERLPAFPKDLEVGPAAK